LVHQTFDVKNEKCIFLAREGLKAPLPDCWKPCKTGDDNYYFNFITGESIWDHPCDQIYKEKFQKEKQKLMGKVNSLKLSDRLSDSLSVSSQESETSDTEPSKKNTALHKISCITKVPFELHSSKISSFWLPPSMDTF